MITDLSYQYRLMIYFAYITFVMYSKTIVDNDKMSVNEFRIANELVIQRVFEEGKSLFKYELSFEQMNRAIIVYISSKYKPQSVLETEPYIIDYKS